MADREAFALSSRMHANAICIDGKGVLIAGQSGTGKSTLALALLRRARLGGLEACLIADDYTDIHLENHGPMLCGPQEIAGKIEVTGFGIVDCPDLFGTPAPLALVAILTKEGDDIRFHDDETAIIDGHSKPCLWLRATNAEANATAIFCALGHSPLL